MKFRAAILLLAVALAASPAAGQVPGGPAAALVRAKEAFRSGHFAEAAQICEAALAVSPGDYELGFLLARAFGAEGEYGKALARAGALLAASPANTDVLLFKGRVETWSKDYGTAEATFRGVLGIRPGDVEATLGLAQLALLNDDSGRAVELYQRALTLSPGDAEALYGMGRALRRRGDLRKAKDYFGQALRLDPTNGDFRRAFEQTDPSLQSPAEVRYQLRDERFSGGRGGYVNNQVAFQFGAPRNLGTAVLKLNQMSRAGQGDVQFGTELYPRLWRRAYAYLDLAYSPGAHNYPRTSGRAEVYQGLFDAAEFSLGFWTIAFPAQTVNLYLASGAYYFGSYYAVLRLTHNPGAGANKTSWLAQLRRYFSDLSYAYIGYGRGERPFEIGTVQDLLVQRSWALVGGLNWYLFRSLKLELSLSRVEDDHLGIRRDTLVLSTGYRW